MGILAPAAEPSLSLCPGTWPTLSPCQGLARGPRQRGDHGEAQTCQAMSPYVLNRAQTGAASKPLSLAEITLAKKEPAGMPSFPARRQCQPGPHPPWTPVCPQPRCWGARGAP